MNVLDRIKSLLDRARDEGASEEERRTSAVIAARLIHDHNVVVALQTEGASVPIPNIVIFDFSKWDELEARRMAAPYPAKCGGCQGTVSFGEWCWCKPGVLWHLGCYRA